MAKEYKQPEEEEKSSNIVEEPAIAYGYSSRRYSYADYLTWIDDKAREIINGIVKLMSPAPTNTHAQISSNLVYTFESYIRKRKGKCKVRHAPFDVRLPKNGETSNDKIYTIVQPDICVICDLSKLDERGCLGAPDLVVEIQSPSTAVYDLKEKFSAYEMAGVQEYWVVFPGMNGVTIFELQKNGRYDEGTAYQLEGTIHSKILKELNIDIKDIFSY